MANVADGSIGFIGEFNGAPMVAAIVLTPQGPVLAHSAEPGTRLRVLQLIGMVTEQLRLDAILELAKNDGEAPRIMRIVPPGPGAA
jgi:hypothetical protein